METEFVVYILVSNSFQHSYVGMTANLIGRMASHNTFGKGYTAKNRPWTVVHIDIFSTKKEAMKREKYYKSGRGLYIKKEIIQSYINKPNL